MIHRLSILCLALPLLHAQELREAAKKSPIALLPNGSVLQGVLLPRYDLQRNLVGDLRAGTMTLIDGDHIQGENVLIKFYNPDRSLRGKVALTQALFDQAKSVLTAQEPVKITNDRLIAEGNGLVYSFESGRGFLSGPVATRISAPPTETSMNPKSLSLPSAAAILSFATAALTAAPPAFVTPEELAAIKAQAASKKPEVEAANRSISESLTVDTNAGNEASAAAGDFMKSNRIRTIASEPAGETDAKPLDVKPGPNDTIITSNAGMYFDADEGILVYLGNVEVTDPRFTLSGANELKVFFEKKPAEAVKDKDTKKDGEAGLAGGANFGEVRKIVADGTVRILQRGVNGKEPIEASGRLLTYDTRSGEIIISERFPWVKQGKSFYARAKQANLSLRLLKNGDFSLTPGNWEMGGNLNLNRQ